MRKDQGTKNRYKSKIVNASFFVISFVTVVLGCGQDSARPSEFHDSPPFVSFRDVPGVTDEEVKAIEALREQFGKNADNYFVYGVDYSIEAFPVYAGQDKEGGEYAGGEYAGGEYAVGGYAARFCEWLTDLFGIPFIPTLYTDDWDNLLAEFESGKVHFMGDLMPTPERRKNHFMTGAIAERSLRAFQLEGENSIIEIAKSRPPRLAFPKNFIPYNNVIETAEYAFETVFVDNFAHAYRLLAEAEVDAFVTMNTSEPVFDVYGNVVSETFFPLVFASVSFSTQNVSLAPIISVVQKALENGGRAYLTKLYTQGHYDYIRNKLFGQLTGEELDYIRSKPVVRVMAETGNYPISFYNDNENEFQGIAFDVLKELELITGLSFEIANTQHTTFISGTEILESGEVSMITELGWSRGRVGRFLWPETPIMRDYSILITKSEFPDIHFNELEDLSVGIVRGTAHAALFKSWFPGNTDYREYDSSDRSFNALAHGEVDALLARANYLLSLENYKEIAGYRVNLKLDNYFNCFFGFNKDEVLLCAIVDKVLKLIDLETISGSWTRKTYDYRAKMTTARLPLLIGATALSLIVLGLMLLIFRRQRQEGKRLENLVTERTEELNWQNSLMSTVNAAAAVLLEPNTDGGLSTINRSMEMVCQSIDADRVYLWQNARRDDGRLYFRQVCKWVSPKYAQSDDTGMVEFDYERTPGMQSMFSIGKSLNGPVDSLSEPDSKFFSTFKIRSILAVPLFFNDELWGFVRFDDCQNRCFFAEAGEYTLRSWGMLVVGAILRGNILQDLKNATDKAKNASQAKSRFIANMSHEMRTPMNVIVGLTDLMLEEDKPININENLNKINTAGNTLMGIINDVLDFSKIEAGRIELKPVQYEMAGLLNDIITLNMIRIEEKPIIFTFDITGDLPSSLIGDDLRVKQILNNLLSNAFKYTKKGTITFGATDCQWENEQDGAGANSVWISFYISDTGIGIREGDMAKLFTDYNQVDASANREIDGVGLGLSITKKFVEMMDGKISVESEYGKGTTFRVRIRQGFVGKQTIGKETVENICNFRYIDTKKQAQGKLVRPDLSYARVLVVDDFPTNLDVAAGMLGKYKMQVNCVTNGKDAIDLIAAEAPLYDAVFMDHMMPGMDGVETTLNIRALGTKYAKNLPVIALTANAVAGSEQMFLDNGFSAFLPKPLSIMSLDHIVQRWVRDKSRE
jgi:signal transduction histidine kinase/ABC-type amino acid transport substrate-binding protein